MYRQHFGLTHYPFERTLHSDELFASAAAARPAHGWSTWSSCAASGCSPARSARARPPSAAARRRLASGAAQAVLRPAVHRQRDGHVQGHRLAAGPAHRAQPRRAYRAIHNEVCRLAVECRIHPVLVVDEAQHLRNDVLEDLRLLTNYAMDSEPRLCLLLVGLTELRRRLTPWPCTSRWPAHRRALAPRWPGAR
jgi:general secretion pathway protein A